MGYNGIQWHTYAIQWNTNVGYLRKNNRMQWNANAKVLRQLCRRDIMLAGDQVQNLAGAAEPAGAGE